MFFTTFEFYKSLLVLGKLLIFLKFVLENIQAKNYRINHLWKEQSGIIG